MTQSTATTKDYFFTSIYENNFKQFSLLFISPQLTDDNLRFGYSLACSYGNVNMVKHFLSSSQFFFDESLHGCTVIEYGIMASCQKESKTVLDHLINTYSITLTPSVESWLIENKLKKILSQINKKNPPKTKLQ